MLPDDVRDREPRAVEAESEADKDADQHTEADEEGGHASDPYMKSFLQTSLSWGMSGPSTSSGFSSISLP